MPETKIKTDRALFTCGLLLHAGYVGAVIVAAGLIQLFAGDATWPSALALILFGGSLALGSWRRAWTVVEVANRVPAIDAHLPPPEARLRRVVAAWVDSSVL
jgi:hypothetical protein